MAVLVRRALCANAMVFGVYTKDNHNTVDVRIRESVLNQGSTVTPYNLTTIRGKYGSGEPGSCFHVREQNPVRRNMRVLVPDQDVTDDEPEGYICSLFHWSAIFRCKKVDLELIPFGQQGEHLKGPNKGGKWLVLLDDAKGCITASPNLYRFSADFLAILFYRLFGSLQVLELSCSML